MENLAKLCHKKVVLRFNQEPAILDLIDGVLETRQDPTIPQNSHVGESQSNGLVERAVRSSKVQIHTRRLALPKNESFNEMILHPLEINRVSELYNVTGQPAGLSETRTLLVLFNDLDVVIEKMCSCRTKIFGGTFRHTILSSF